MTYKVSFIDFFGGICTDFSLARNVTVHYITGAFINYTVYTQEK